MQQLTPRLAAVAGFVVPDSPLADIGTDHAYLPIALVAAGVVPRAIATDLRPGPLAAARQAVAAVGLAARIELRLGDGLHALGPGEVETVVLAGMGGALIANLLGAAPAAVRSGLRRLVLQPMSGEAALRGHLPEMGWRIADEALAAEGGRIYPVVVAEPGHAAAAALDELDAVLGPVLRRRGGALFAAYGRGVAERLARASRAAAGASTAAGRARGEALRGRAAQVLRAVEEGER